MWKEDKGKRRVAGIRLKRGGKKERGKWSRVKGEGKRKGGRERVGEKVGMRKREKKQEKMTKRVYMREGK